MRKIFLILFVLALFVGKSQAQIIFNCDSRQYCDVDPMTGVISNCESQDEFSVFVLSADQTYFWHAISDMISTYTVSSSSTGENGELILNVTSEAGNDYIYYFDLKNERVRAYFNSGQNKGKRLVEFHIKISQTPTN
jgi:hypothetical protein